MSEMTLSQALRRIKKIKGDLAESLSRSLSSVTWRVGADPAFSFDDLVEEANKLRTELISLKAAVALTNATTFIKNDQGVEGTLASAVVTLSELKAALKWLDDLKSYVKNQKSIVEDERTWDDVTDKTVMKKVQTQCALPEADRVARVNAIKAQFEALNDAVETANHRWTVLVTSGQIGEQGK